MRNRGGLGRASAALALAAMAARAQAPPPVPAAREPAQPSLGSRIERVLAASPVARSAFWGIRVYDLTRAKTLYDLNPDRLFVPASNTKLFTMALALARLDPETRFATRVLADAPPDSSGVLRGTLRLVGGGDPNLSPRTIPYHAGAVTGNPLAAIEDLAGQVAAHGIQRIEGGIAGDDTYYVFEPYPDGWSVDDPQYDYGTAVSALAVNDNTIRLAIRPGAHAGEPAALRIQPQLDYYDFDNRIRTTTGGERHIEMLRQPGSFHVRLWGTVPLHDRGEDLLLGVEDPALFAAEALRDALEARGIAVTGPSTAIHRFPDQAPSLMGPAPPPAATEGFELARRVSAPLVEDLKITAKVSQNLHAEMALRAVGRARRGVGSREAGLEELKAFLTEAGVDQQSYALRDGSGLSRPNLVSPAAVIQLLRHMYASPARETWISLLPLGGEDGTLSGRFGEAVSSGRIHAKTGTLSHVTALSGYAERPGGAWLAFSILVNNYGSRAPEIRAVVDRIAAMLVE